MIDPTKETLITITEAAKIVPGRPHVSTVHRWINKGRGESRVKLEAIYGGKGGRRTTKEALDRFFENLTAARSRLRNEEIEMSASRKREIDNAESKVSEALGQ